MWFVKGGNTAYVLLPPVPVSSVVESEVFFLFIVSGRFLGKVETNGAAPWAPNKQQSLITEHTHTDTHTHAWKKDVCVRVHAS